MLTEFSHKSCKFHSKIATRKMKQLIVYFSIRCRIFRLLFSAVFSHNLLQYEYENTAQNLFVTLISKFNYIIYLFRVIYYVLVLGYLEVRLNTNGLSMKIS